MKRFVAESRTLVGILSLLGAGVLWGLIGAATRFPLAEGVKGSEIAFYRAAIAGLAFLLLVRQAGGKHRGQPLSKQIRDLPRKVWPPIVAFSVFGVAGLVLSNVKAVETGGVGFAAVFLYLAPLWVAIWGRLFVGERLTPMKTMSLILTLAGVALVGFFGRAGEGVELLRYSPEALAWGLLSGFSYSLFYVFSRAYFRVYSPWLLNGLCFTLGAVALLGVNLGLYGAFPAGIPALPGSQAISTSAWGGIFFAGVFSTLFAYALYAEGMKRIEATRASLICSIEPVIAIFSAYVLWGETLSLLGYAGAGFVLAGVSLSAISESENPRAA